MKLISRVFILYYLCWGLRLASTSDELEFCQVSEQLDTECASYAFTIVKPMFGYFEQLQREIDNNRNITDNKDIEIKALHYKLHEHTTNAVVVEELRNRIEELQSSLEFYKTTIEKLTDHLVSGSNATITFRSSSCEQCEVQPPSSCVPFTDSPGIHRIAFANLYAFDVLCQNVTAGSGWIVVQQRIDGREDFYRDWATYREGFGSFEGDFFLGLEKIHRLTNYERHELHITMEKFDGSVAYARYNRFVIAGENDNYRLLSLGEFSGSRGTEDHLRYHEKMEFSTMDRDNDDWIWNNCAKGQHAGWWYSWCSRNNLNGKFFDHAVQLEESIWWGLKTQSLKKVKMLIRPKAD